MYLAWLNPVVSSEPVEPGCPSRAVEPACPSSAVDPVFHSGLRRRYRRTGGSTPTTSTPATSPDAYRGVLACPSWLGGRSPTRQAATDATTPTTQIVISAGARNPRGC